MHTRPQHSSSTSKMRRSLAPSVMAKDTDDGVTPGQANTMKSDQTDLLPVRTKRKFACPASIAPGQTAAMTGVSKTKVCHTLPVADPKGAEQTVSPAQYYTVLYTKRAANKVLKHCSRYILMGLTKLMMLGLVCRKRRTSPIWMARLKSRRATLAPCSMRSFSLFLL